MKITYDTNTNSGYVNEHYITEKPKFSFEYAWFLVTDTVAQKLLSYGGMSENEVMSEAEKAEVLAFANAFTPPAPEAPKELSFDEKKQAKLRELNDFINSKFYSFLAKYPEVEQRSFDKKVEESLLVTTSPTIELGKTPYLTALTGNTSVEARNQRATEVMEKVTENATLEAFAVQTRDRIKATTTKEQLEAIRWDNV